MGGFEPFPSRKRQSRGLRAVANFRLHWFDLLRGAATAVQQTVVSTGQLTAQGRTNGGRGTSGGEVEAADTTCWVDAR